MPPIVSPIVQVVGYKNAGKTTLLCRLVERFKAEGLTVATIKHDAHRFDMDRPGTDTARHMQAGADMTAISSPGRTAWLSARAMELDELIARMTGADIMLVEGFKEADYPKLVLLRDAADLPLLRLPGALAAVVPAGMPIEDADGLPVLARDDIDAIMRLVRRVQRL